MRFFCLAVLCILSFNCSADNFISSPDEEKKAFENFPYYNGTVFPVPQQISYRDDFFDLSGVLIKTGAGVDKDSTALRLWLDRINFSGGKYFFFSGKPSLIVTFAIDEKILKKEAYSIKIFSPSEITVTAHDKTALTWACFSMVQLTTSREGKAVMRKAEISDFPEVTCSRGTWANFSFRNSQPGVLLGKLNRVVFYRGPLVMEKPPREFADYRYFFTSDPHPEWIASVKEAAVFYNALGIEIFVGFLPMHVPGLTPENKFNAADEKEVGYMLKNWLAVAEAGANVYVGYDDHRFPRNPAESQKFAFARDADSYVLNYLYSEVKRKYPDFKLIFCPPFYWGPAYDPSPGYGESRDEYLKTIGEKLDKSIEIAWTGKAVWSGKIQKGECDWEAAAIKRKPLHMQNDTSCPHVAAAFYLSDPADVWLWPYKGFYDDISGIMVSSAIGSRIFPALGGAALWNMKSYKAADAVRDLDGKFFGEGSWAYADNLNKALSKLEVYECKVSGSSVRDLPKIKESVIQLNAAWSSALKKNAPAFKTFAAGFVISSIKKMDKFLAALEKAKADGKFNAVGDVESDKKSAVKDCSFNDTKDVFLSALDFAGGDTPRVFIWKQKEKRLGTLIRAKDFANHSLRTVFKTTIPPSKESYDLFICAQGDDSKEQGLPHQCRIAVSVNGNPVFSGPAPFVSSEWKLHCFKVRGAFLREGENIVTIDSLEEKGNFSGPPFFILNYAVFKDVK